MKRGHWHVGSVRHIFRDLLQLRLSFELCGYRRRTESTTTGLRSILRRGGRLCVPLESARKITIDIPKQHSVSFSIYRSCQTDEQTSVTLWRFDLSWAAEPSVLRHCLYPNWIPTARLLDGGGRKKAEISISSLYNTESTTTINYVLTELEAGVYLSRSGVALKCGTRYAEGLSCSGVSLRRSIRCGPTSREGVRRSLKYTTLIIMSKLCCSDGKCLRNCGGRGGSKTLGALLLVAISSSRLKAGQRYILLSLATNISDE